MRSKYKHRGLEDLIQLHEETLKILEEINNDVEKYRISIKPYIVGYLQYLTVKSYISLINLKILEKLRYKFGDNYYIKMMYENLRESADYYIKKIFFNKSK